MPPKRTRMETDGEAKGYKCRYCGDIFRDKRTFADHKRDKHWEEMSQSTVRSSIASGGTLPLQPPRRPAPRGRPRRQQVSPPPPPVPMSPPSPASEENEEEEEEEETETSTVVSSKKGRGKGKKGTARKSGAPAKKTNQMPHPIGHKNMPLPIGKKRPATDPKTGKQVEDWMNNPRFNSG